MSTFEEIVEQSEEIVKSFESQFDDDKQPWFIFLFWIFFILKFFGFLFFYKNSKVPILFKTVCKRSNSPEAKGTALML